MRAFLLSVVIAFSFSATLRAEYSSCPPIQAGTAQASCAAQVIEMIQQAQAQESSLYTASAYSTGAYTASAGSATVTWEQYCAAPQVVAAMNSCLQSMSTSSLGTSQLNSTYYGSSAASNYSLDNQLTSGMLGTSGYTGTTAYPYNPSSTAIDLTSGALTNGAVGGSAVNQ